jgi:lipopolysaccharide export system protein LptA
MECMSSRITTVVAVLLALIYAPIVHAQQGNVDFGGLRADPKLPVEVTADSFSIDQATHNAIFSGAVRVAQGDMIMTAGEVTIEYAEDGKSIRRLVASGGVVLKAGADAAQASTAIYIIDSAEITLSGDVLLTQGSAAISGQKLVVDLTNGTGRIEGGVTTTFIPGGN